MLVATTLCALALLQPAAAPTFPWERHETRLDNGLRVVVVPTDKSGSFALYEIVGTGSRDEVEPGRSGFAHFFEHMMFRGTKAFPADARTALLARLGVDEGGYTTGDYTAYHLQGPSTALPELFALEADRYMNLEYSEDDFKTESRAVLGEYNKNFSNPDMKAWETISDLAFDTHTYKHTTMGFLKDIEAMPEAFAYSRSFFQRFYRPDNVILLVVGDVDVGAVQARAKETFGAWQGARAKTALKDEPGLTAERKKTIAWANPTQPRLHVGWRVPSATTDATQAALGLLVQQYVFAESSDLVKGLVLGDPSTDRGTPLAEQVSCWWGLRKDASLFPVVVKMKETSPTAEVLDRVQAHLDAVAAGKINDRRFADVKSNLRYSLLMGLTSPDRVAGALARVAGPSMDVGFIDEVYAALQAMTPKDLQAYVKKHFSKNQRAIVELRHTPTAPSATTPAAAGSTK